MIEWSVGWLKVVISLNSNGKSILSEDGSGIVYVTDSKVSMTVPATLTNLESFFQGMRLRYNDGQGTKDIVTFLGADFIDDMQLKCKIRQTDDSEILVDLETLNSFRTPKFHQFHRPLQITFAKARISHLHIWKIFCIPRHFHHYRKKWWVIIHNYITCHFQSFSPWQRQEKFHIVLHPWKDAVLFVWLVFLALHTSILGVLSWNKVIPFERNQIIALVPKLPWIFLFQHNRA